MSLTTRLDLYRQIEAHRRSRPLVVYVTSTRPGFEINVCPDVPYELAQQLDQIGAADALDFLIITSGGDMATAFHIVSVIRERVQHFSVLVPAVATSAGTLIGIGASTVAIHPAGCLGPIDPQFTGQQTSAIPFGSEDIAAYLQFATVRADVMKEQLAAQVGPVALGCAARAAQHLPREVERLLLGHMRGFGAKWKARKIARKLITGFPSHCSRVSRAEAVAIGLPVEPRDQVLERLMRDVTADFDTEFQVRESWNPLRLIRDNPFCEPLFAPVPLFNVPCDAPPDAFAILNQTLSERIAYVPLTPYRLLAAVVESPRLVSHNIVEGFICPTRKDYVLTAALTQTGSGWVAPFGPSPQSN